jgi:ADP-dependent NAD(P)H-hydrate dehydratase / NAD(P)H-hydrate epimerase
MKLVTCSEMRKIEERSEIPENILMESAGALAAKEILTRYLPELKRGDIAVFCGTGNNGADGLVVARHLAAAGYSQITIFHLGLSNAKPLFKEQLERGEFTLAEASSADLSKFSLIIDALFGIGLNRELSSEMQKLIGKINAAKRPIVSLDVPSGLNADKGVVEGTAIKAQLTLTFTAAKIGFYTGLASEYTGVIRVLPIGIAPDVVAAEAKIFSLFEEPLARKLLPERKALSNKSTFGRLLVCAGRPGFWGAGVLSTQAAFRIGAGYVTGFVTWAGEKEPLEELRSHPEVLTASVEEALGKSYSAYVVGPGFGVEPAKHVIKELKKQKAPVVLDADGLTALAEAKCGVNPNWILTPHTGELSRLLGISSEAIEADRFAAVLEAAQKFGCYVFLKGFRTLIAHEDRCVVIASGNPALAKAGTGDVLAGFVGGLLAQGLTPWKAASLGAFLHGRIADEWVKSGRDVASLVASDLEKSLPEVLSLLRGRA